MNSPAFLPPVPPAAPNPLAKLTPKRSMGLKLLVVAGLALVMMLLSLFIDSMIEDRTHRANSVKGTIGSAVGGPESILGPLFIVPYKLPEKKDGTYDSGWLLLSGTQATTEVTAKTEERHRSLFKVPIYRANFTFKSTFDLKDIATDAPAGATLDWTKSEFVIGASDASGALSDATLTLGGQTLPFAPSAAGTITLNRNAMPDSDESFSGNDHNTEITLFGINYTGAATNVAIEVHAQFSGAQDLTLFANGRTSNISIKSDWPNPGFYGNFLPVSRTITPSGFDAAWTVPYIARGVRISGELRQMQAIGHTAMGVSFVELVDPYQSVTRAVKYAPLFIFLVFLTYFLFEVTTGHRVHPAQYVLIGIAQTTFYVLLLSIAERLGFDWGFIVAAAATVGLISVYAHWVFSSRIQGLRALAVFSVVYALIYILLRLEDEAMLVGSIATFLAVALAMYFTRRLNWYGEEPPAGACPLPPA